MTLHLYIFASVLLVIVNLFYGITSLRTKSRPGLYFGMAAIICSITGGTYLVSILLHEDRYFLMSFMSSLYFLSIDALLLCLIYYAKALGHFQMTRREKLAVRILLIYALFEAVVFLINPFHEIVVGYQLRDTQIAHFSYVMKPLYVIHLAYTYLMIVSILWIMIRGSFRVPREYRSVFYFLPLMIVIIVLLNAIFLFLPNKGIFSQIDISICLYALAIVCTYWHSNYYSKRSMLVRFKSTLFDSINQGMMMFDYNDDLILYNDRSAELFSRVTVRHGISLSSFIREAGLDFQMSGAESRVPLSDHSFTCFTKNGADSPLRCDYKLLRNSQNAILGKLFVFTDLAGRIDLLTGFVNWESFLRHKDETDMVPSFALMCDISGLSSINKTLGHAEGDRMIRSLSESLKQNLPFNTFFIRTHDASMIALCYDMDEKSIHAAMRKVVSDFGGNLQYAISPVTSAETLLEDIQVAARGVNTRKLLDNHSVRSATLSSLIRALKECDPDTESHVKRTQTMGQALGEVIGLNDIEQSDLALLCLLHDIGKVGVPLEILNKPGKLTNEEFAILRSHVEKGYNIAVSSPELKAIADMIRFHHERWDGRGYPDRIAGKEIPLLSRIISVIDAYDAMVSTRSYKSAMSRQEALNEILRCAGTQFDPHIAASFVQLLNDRPDLGISETSITGQSQMLMIPKEPASTALSSAISSSVSIPISRYLLDSQFRIISVDSFFEKMTGYTEEDVHKMHLTQVDLIPDLDRPEYLRLLNSQITMQSTNLFKHPLKKKDGTTTTVYCFGRMFYDPAARSERSEIVISERPLMDSIYDFSESERIWSLKQLRKWDNETRRDPSTGLLTAKAFRAELDVELMMEDSMILLFNIYAERKSHDPFTPVKIMYTDTLIRNELRRDDISAYLGDNTFAAAIFFDRNVSSEVIIRRAEEIYQNYMTVLRSEPDIYDVRIGYVISQSDTQSASILLSEALKDSQHHLRLYTTA